MRVLQNVYWSILCNRIKIVIASELVKICFIHWFYQTYVWLRCILVCRVSVQNSSKSFLPQSIPSRIRAFSQSFIYVVLKWKSGQLSDALDTWISSSFISDSLKPAPQPPLPARGITPKKKNCSPTWRIKGDFWNFNFVCVLKPMGLQLNSMIPQFHVWYQCFLILFYRQSLQGKSRKINMLLP